MIRSQACKTLGLWVLIRDIVFTPGGRTGVESLLVLRRLFLRGLLRMSFAPLFSTTRMGMQDANDDKSKAKQGGQGHPLWLRT